MPSFVDQLEDFGAPTVHEDVHDNDEHAEEGEEREEEEVDPSIRLLPEELEALKAEAHESGRQIGEEQAQAALSETMAESLQHVLTFVSEEGVRRSELVHQMADQFTEALYAIVRELVSGELKRDVIRRDMIKDIASFAQECEGELQLSCSKEDAASLKSVLKDVRGMSLVTDPDLPTGRATVSSKEAVITVDKNEWVNTVRDRVLESVRSIIQTSQQNTRTRT